MKGKSRKYESKNCETCKEVKMKTQEFIKVTEKVIESLEHKVYEVKIHLGRTIIVDLRNYWDDKGNLNEIYYINYIENHGEYIREVSSC